MTRLAEELTSQRAEERIGEHVDVLVESVAGGDPDTEDPSTPAVEGRAAHQGPEVDGSTLLTGPGTAGLRVGDLVAAVVTANDGVDLVAEPETAR